MKRLLVFPAALATVLACNVPGLLAMNDTPGTDAGEALYQQSCRACHGMMPPAQIAPPIPALANRYRQVYGSKDKAVAAMASFMAAPSTDKALLGRGAMQRFGLMPPIALEQKDLETVAGWVWDQYDPDFDTRSCR
ncbi:MULTISPECIES: c-type cytochrome [Prosthecochloris]|nr:MULTISPECIES: c-type cytochrome [Prosthecochloris]ANT64055.1 Cytochrome c [Prosthecochloris sp. CIB 2401]